ncbi:MAG: hypothetical protein ACW99A_20075, partial [Candidatus Kariarchaeaceae archaeon]
MNPNLENDNSDDLKMDIPKDSSSKTDSPSSSMNIKSISWDTFQDTIEDSYTFNSLGWEFGPTPTYKISYLDGSEIGLMDPIQKGPSNKLAVDILIPMDVLLDTDLGFAGFSLSITGDSYYQAVAMLGYSNMTFDFGGIPFIKGWFSFTYEINNTVFGSPELFVYDEAKRSVNLDESTDIVTIHIVGHIPMYVVNGRWDFSLFMLDENQNQISIPHDPDDPNPAFRDIYIGTTDLTTTGFNGYKTKITDSSGEEIDFVSRGEPFYLNLTVGSKFALDSVVIDFQELPQCYNQKIYSSYLNNVTTIDSGWIYDETSGSYKWISGLDVDIQEQLYGSFDIFDEYCPHSPSPEERESILFMAFGNGTIVSKIGHMPDGESEYVLRDLTSNIKDNLLTLDNNTSSIIPDISGNFFNIVFNLTANYSLSKYSQLPFYAHIKDINNSYIGTFGGVEDYQERVIYVETQFAKTQIFTSEGEVTTHMLRLDETDYFAIKSTIANPSTDFDIQAVSLTLRGDSHQITKTYSLWSEVEIVARYDFRNEEINVDVYNMTRRNIQADGEYKEYVRVDRIGYHWEYNYTLGEDEWIYGPYSDWELRTKDGLHWQDEYYDQRTGEWLDGWVDWRSPATKIGDNSSDTLKINSRSVTYNQDELIFDMNLSTTLDTPQLPYHFDVRFETIQWGEDYGNYGYHESEKWSREPVPRIDINGEDTFVDILKYPLYLEYNNHQYLINETAYINITNRMYSIRSFIEYDFETQESTQKLVIESWNPSTDETVLYYTFANGTRVYIEDDTATKIYTLKFDNLLVSGTDLEYLSETQFHSFQWYATMEDVGGGFYNYTFPLVNGSKLEIKSTLLDEVYDDNLNINVYLTNYCSIVDTTDIQLEDKVYYLNLYQFDGNKLELARQLEVEHANPRYHWLTESYYVVDASTGERFYFEKNSTWTDEQYCNSVCGLTAEYLMNVSNIIYVVGEGRERIEGIFTVTDLNLDANPFNVLDRYAFNIYYVKGSPTISLLPTHSTPARSYSDLFYTTSNPDHPGLVPVKKTVTINDEIVDLTLLVDGWELKFEDETTEIFSLDSVKADDLLLIIDRQNYWNASSTGFSIQYGKLHPYENRLTDIFGSLDVITPIDENGFH